MPATSALSKKSFRTPLDAPREERFANAHTRYDPDYSNQLLDELGLEDINGDGLREYPDGTPLTITFEYLDFETPTTMTMELVRDYWRTLAYHPSTWYFDEDEP